MKYFLLTILILQCSLFSAFSQEEKYDCKPIDSFRKAKASDAIISKNICEGYYYGIAEIENANQAVFNDLTKKGIRIDGQLNEHIYKVCFPGHLSLNKLGKGPVKSLGRITPKAKKSPLLDEELEGETEVKILVREGIAADNELLANLVNNLRYVRNHIVGSVNANNLSKLLELPFVDFVAPVLEKPRPLLEKAMSMNRVNVVHDKSAFGHGFKGAGIDIGVWDGGLLFKHIDIDARVFNADKIYWTDEFSKHANGVTGIINSKGHFNARYIGMAPESKVYAHFFNGDLVGKFQSALSEFNLKVISVSFGYGTSDTPCEDWGPYLPMAAELDALVREREDLMNVVAVANAGTPGDRCPDGWGTVGIGFQGAKNNIAVGSVDRLEILANNSSKGPTADGRLKPEIVSMGRGVYTTNIDNGYQERQGTSFSCPSVSGIVALLYEAFIEKNGASALRADIIKAILLNTARDKGNDGPDYKYGFGVVNADRAIESVFEEAYFVDEVGNEDSVEFTINTLTSKALLKFTLTWMDKEASFPFDKTLVHDLDLIVVAPNGDRFHPWVLDPSNPSAVAFRGVDNLNNSEQITIEDASAGTYKIIVKGSNILSGAQKFAVAHNSYDHSIKVTHPTGGEKWVAGGETVYLRWDTEGNHDHFDIDVSYDNGASWTNIASNLDADLRYATWPVPADTTSHTCLLRVSSNLSSGISEEVFTISSRVASLNVEGCDRGARLSWDSVALADQYIINQLINDEYVSLDTVGDFDFFVNGLNNGEEYWFNAIALIEGKPALRSNGALVIPVSTNTCNLNNDILVDKLLTPLGGRSLTSSLLTANEKIKVRVSNNGINNASGFNVCYDIDGQGAVCETIALLNAGASVEHEFAASGDFSNLSNYEIEIWTELASDEDRSNDTLKTTIKNLSNDPTILPYFQGFEDVVSANTYLNGAFGMDNIEEIDFTSSTLGGRLRVGGNDIYAFEGTSALSFDNYLGGSNNVNEFVVNLNLDAYNDSTIYLDFDFLDHGEEADLNDKVWIRGSDTDTWIELYDLGNNIDLWAVYNNVHALNLTKTIQALNGQSFSSSFQMKFGQEGSGVNNNIYSLDGFSFDNIKVYNVNDDISVSNLFLVDSVCPDSNYIVSAELINNSKNAVSNVTIELWLNESLVASEIVDNILAYETKEHTFEPLNLYNPQSSVLLVRCDYSNDLYERNDTLSKRFRVEKFDTVKIDSVICIGMSVLIGSASITDHGIHYVAIPTNYCDSIVELNLTVNDTFNITINKSSCFVVDTGRIFSNLLSVNGCDSTVTTITSLLYPITSNLMTQSCNPLDTGVVIDTLIGQASNGCDSIRTITTTLISSKPIAKFSYQFTSDTVYTFTNLSADADSFYWDFGDLNTSSLVNPVHYFSSGTYDVLLIAFNDCGVDSFTQTIDIVTTGIELPDFVSKLNIFPNPASDNLNLQLQIQRATNIEAHIYDYNGRTLLSDEFGWIDGNLNEQLNVSSLSRGAYYLELRFVENGELIGTYPYHLSIVK